MRCMVKWAAVASTMVLFAGFARSAPAQVIARPLPDPAITDLAAAGRIDDIAVRPDGRRPNLAKLTAAGVAVDDWIAELPATSSEDFGRTLVSNGRGRIYVVDPAVPNGFAAYPELADDMIFAHGLE